MEGPGDVVSWGGGRRVRVQVKSSLLYCQFFHMYSTYIQRIEIALLSDPWCIQLTLNTDSRRSNKDKYSLTICTYKLYRYTNEDIVEKNKKNKKEIQPQIRKSWDSMENANKKRK